MQVRSEDKHKLFPADYQKELEAMWRRHHAIIQSRVLCEHCNPATEDIKRQIYLAKLRRKSGLLEALISNSVELNDTDDSNDDNNKTLEEYLTTLSNHDKECLTTTWLE